MRKSKLIIVLNALLKGTKDALTTTALGKGVGTFVTEIASNYDKLTKSQKGTLAEAKPEEIKNALKGTENYSILVGKVKNIETHLLNLLKDKLEHIDTKTDLLPGMDKKLDKLIDNQNKPKGEKTSRIKPKEIDDKRDLVFLSYANEDLERVGKVYEGLLKRRLNVWFDKASMKGGKWKPKIKRAISHSRYFILCISDVAIQKMKEFKGFQNEEFEFAYEFAMNQPESVFTIYPVRLEDCDRGDLRISSYHEYDLFNDFEVELDKLAVDLGGISLEEVIERIEKSEDEKLVESLMNKGEALNFSAQYKRSLSMYQLVIDIQPDNSSAINKLGSAWKSLGEYKKAIDYFEKALKIDLKAYDENHPKVATYYNNLGAAWKSLGEYKKAIDYYEKALKILEKKLGKKHPHIITVRKNLESCKLSK